MTNILLVSLSLSLSLSLFSYFQVLTNAHPIRARTEPRVWILYEVIAAIANLDKLAATAKQVTN